MNTLSGEIITIATEQNISLVKVLAEGRLFYSLILDSPETSPWLETGAPVHLLFKETEVMLALPTPTPLPISVPNQLRCHIRSIKSDTILCELTLTLSSTPMPSPFTSFHAPATSSSPSTIKAILTRSDCDALSLKENDPVIALIKTNEVSLAHD